MVLVSCREQCETAVGERAAWHVAELTAMIEHFGYQHPGIILDVGSHLSFTKLDPNPMISLDKQSVLLRWTWRINATTKSLAEGFADDFAAKINFINDFDTKFKVAATGPIFLNRAMKETLIHEVPVHELKTIWLPFAILAYRLRSLRLLLLALMSMPISILISFGMMYFVSLYTTVLTYAIMMMLMLCTALSFDYSLFSLTRYQEERDHGQDNKEAVITVITQSGHVIMVSGLVLTIAYAAMLVLPGAFKTFCVAACFMIIICIGVQLTFVTSLLAIFPWLGGGSERAVNLKHLAPLPGEEAKASQGFLEDLESTPSAVLSPTTPWSKAQQHRSGIYYEMGIRLTSWPMNLLVPITIFALMSPLTRRAMSYNMGHAYEQQLPRHREEWSTAQRIQRDYMAEVGCLMPTVVIASNPPLSDIPWPERVVLTTNTSSSNSSVPPPVQLPIVPPVSDPEQLKLPQFHQPILIPDHIPSISVPSFPEIPGMGPKTTLPPSPTIAPKELDVRSTNFFQQNCHMIDTIVNITKGKAYQIDVSEVISPTFHGTEEDGRVKCQPYELIRFWKTNYFAQRFAVSSKLLAQIWEEMVNEKNDAMITLFNPAEDPFSSEAFDLMRDMRKVLKHDKNLTIDAPVEYFTYGATAITMDMIEVTRSRLPIAFLGCAFVCFLLIAMSFGAALIPLKLLFTVVLPITWTYGAALCVYEDGWLNFLGYEGLMPTYIGVNRTPAGVDWTVPMFTLTIMLGLALDYDIFLFERVWEFRKEGFGDRESIILGLSATGPIISSAGLIFGLTFVSMLLGSMPVTNQMGFVFLFSILVDTFVVRTVLVPAMLSLSPFLNYWPSKMPPVHFEWLR